MIKRVYNWEDLKDCVSETHEIEFNDYSAWIKLKEQSDDKSFYERNHYLSTHTFYGLNYIYSTYVLQNSGFNVAIENWDEPYLKEMSDEDLVLHVEQLMIECKKEDEAYKARRLKEIEEIPKAEERRTQRIMNIFKPRVDEDHLRRTRLPRNSKCDCGSGLKFKKCCGGVL